LVVLVLSMLFETLIDNIICFILVTKNRMGGTMTLDTVYQGGCLCGDVRFEARGKPNSVSTCHCRSCQRAAGADSVAWAEFPNINVFWLGEKAGVFESSVKVTRTFCKRCGSSLAYQNALASIDLSLACFDNPEIFVPENEIWLDHRLPWNVRNTDIPGYREFRSSGSLVE
jgi:hypothetical protein